MANQHYISGVWYDGANSSRIVGQTVVVYYTTSNSAFDTFTVKGSKAECNRTDTHYESNSNQIREITSDSENLDGVTVHVVFDNGDQVDKKVVFDI